MGTLGWAHATRVFSTFFTLPPFLVRICVYVCDQLPDASGGVNIIRMLTNAHRTHTPICDYSCIMVQFLAFENSQPIWVIFINNYV